jgi:branched-chain amino acid transport system substrate-binding protein/urea transport system substrate-binding protein
MQPVVPSVATSDEPSIKAFVAKARTEAGAGVAVSNYVRTQLVADGEVVWAIF